MGQGGDVGFVGGVGVEVVCYIFVIFSVNFLGDVVGFFVLNIDYCYVVVFGG